MKKGIVLVANLQSQSICENLIYSIRKSGCSLPIRLIHFGGKPVDSKFVLNEVEFLTVDDFSEEAKAFIKSLQVVLKDCPLGYLYRFLMLFSDWDSFLYSDNDIVALMNWEKLFDYLGDDYDLVHADEEYATKGIFNYNKPEEMERIFGEGALSTAITAGHILIRNKPSCVGDFNKAIEWIKVNPGIAKEHDQSLLHIAALLGDWKLLNLCKPPYNWLSSWAGDYKNTLDVIQKVQGRDLPESGGFKVWFSSLSEQRRAEYINDLKSNPLATSSISHIHYSGRSKPGNLPIEELIFSSLEKRVRLKETLEFYLQDYFHILYLKQQKKRIINGLKRRIKF